VWRGGEIVERAVAGLQRRALDLDAEQAVRGLDALDELELHALLAEGLADAGFGVLRERAYPAGEGRKLSERQRCDLVLTPEPGVEPAPILSKVKRKAAAQPGLFERPAQTATRRIPAAECYWLEVKVVGQFEYVAGVPGPNASWGGTLVRSMAEDLGKLSSEFGISHGGLLLVLFTSEAEVAKHDVVQALHRCLDRGVRVSSMDQAAFRLQDRIGNACCTLTLVGVWRHEESREIE